MAFINIEIIRDAFTLMDPNGEVESWEIPHVSSKNDTLHPLGEFD